VSQGGRQGHRKGHSMKYTRETWPEDWINFTYDEFRCSHCAEQGEDRCDMDPGFMDTLQAMRTAYGKGMKITSGYRCPSHPVEMVKSAPGSHSHGLACDVSIQGEEAFMLVRMAFTSGFLGIGIKQHGEGRYVHLDMASHVHRPMLWTYP
jgi:zinc D-Ala-D-Ala carboxypeptidase